MCVDGCIWLPLLRPMGGQRVIGSAEHRMVQDRLSERLLRGDHGHGEIDGGIVLVLIDCLREVIASIQLDIPSVRPSAAVNAPQHIGRCPDSSSLLTLSLSWSRRVAIRPSRFSDSAAAKADRIFGREKPFE